MIAIIGLVALTVAGALVFAFATNPKPSDLGKICFAVGLFWLIAVLLQHPLPLPK